MWNIGLLWIKPKSCVLKTARHLFHIIPLCIISMKYFQLVKLKSCTFRDNVDADDERKSRLTFDEDYE